MADYEDTKVTDLVINNISQEKFDELKAAGELSPTEIYLTPTESGGASGDYLPLSGGTMTGDLEIIKDTDDAQIILGYNSGSTNLGGIIKVASYGFILIDRRRKTQIATFSSSFGLGIHNNLDIGRIGAPKDIYLTGALKKNDQTFELPTTGGTMALVEDIQGIVSVLPTEENGYTTVKNYGNGYVEISGYTAIEGTVAASSGSEIQIDLPAGYTMANDKYWLNIVPTSETSMFDLKAEPKARSTTHFMVAYKNEDGTTALNAAGIYWEVRGMLSTE